MSEWEKEIRTSCLEGLAFGLAGTFARIERRVVGRSKTGAARTVELATRSIVMSCVNCILVVFFLEMDLSLLRGRCEYKCQCE